MAAASAAGGLRLGLGGIAAVVVVGLLFGKKSPMEMLALVSSLQHGAPTQQHAPATRTPAAGSSDNDQTVGKVKRVLGDTEDTWQQIFQASGRSYQPPRLVLFRGGVSSGCGFTGSEVGPFYCPADQKVYLDLGFFDELKQRFGAPGEFAQAYVIAHEVGHHVQNLLGISDKVNRRMQQLNSSGRNALSVRLELQADCFAGVWGHSAAQRHLINAAEMQQALVAANAIGDDTLQKNAGRNVTPDAFTHGTSAQRQHWFQVGLDSGSVDACNTFVRKPAQ